MKFKFPLQNILDHKKVLEEIAQKDYAEAQRQVEEAKKILLRLHDSIDEARNLVFKQELKGESSVKLLETDQFIVGQKVRIERQSKVVSQLLSMAEEKQQILIDAVKEYKTFSKLKEKRWHEFRQLLKKKEIKQVDELVTTRYKRGNV